MKTHFTLSVLIAAMTIAGLSTPVAAEDGINIGGAVRVNYAYKEYNKESKDTNGKLDFDIFALKFNGKKDPRSQS